MTDADLRLTLYALATIVFVSVAASFVTAGALYVSSSFAETDRGLDDVHDEASRMEESGRSVSVAVESDVAPSPSEKETLVEEPSIPVNIIIADETPQHGYKTTSSDSSLKRANLAINLPVETPVRLWSDSSEFRVSVENHGDIHEVVDVAAVSADGEELAVEPASFNLIPGGRQQVRIVTGGSRTLTAQTDVTVSVRSPTSQASRAIPVVRESEGFVTMTESGQEGCGDYALYS